MELFFHSLKGELFRGMKINNADHLRGILKEYLLQFYHSKRLHSGLDYCAPEEFEGLTV